MGKVIHLKKEKRKRKLRKVKKYFIELLYGYPYKNNYKE